MILLSTVRFYTMLKTQDGRARCREGETRKKVKRDGPEKPAYLRGNAIATGNIELAPSYKYHPCASDWHYPLKRQE